MPSRWTDDKHDGLEQRVDEGFANVDKRFEQVDRRFEQVESRLGRVEERIGRLDGDLREFRGEMKVVSKSLGQLSDNYLALTRTLLQIGAGLVGSVVLAGVALIATQL